MAIWHVWVIVGILFFIGEIFTPGFFLACLGIACLGSGIASAFGLGIGSQVLVFSITTLAVFFGIRPFFLKYLHSPGTKVETNVKALVGKTGLVSGKGNKVVYLPYEATGILSSIGGIKDMLEGTKKGTGK